MYLENKKAAAFTIDAGFSPSLFSINPRGETVLGGRQPCGELHMVRK
jgi:hypothetical protein